jgi:predicted kinase
VFILKPHKPKPHKPVLFLMVGLPGAGKTTRAREIELASGALRLTPDEWILALFGTNLDRSQRDSVRDPVEALQWEVAKRVLALGTSVILDWGLWAREERERYRREAEALGADTTVVFVGAPIDELWRRVSQRGESQEGTLAITRDDLETWSRLFEPPTQDELELPSG